MSKKSTKPSSKKTTSTTVATTEFDDLVDNSEELIGKKRKLDDSIVVSSSESDSDIEHGDIDTDSSNNHSIEKPTKSSKSKSKKSTKTNKSKKQKKEKTVSKKPVVVLESESDSDLEAIVQPSTSTAKKSKKSKKNDTDKPREPKSGDNRREKPTKIIEGVDPSSDHKTDTHRHPVNYKKKTYWCTKLPVNFQVQLDGIIDMRKNRDAEVDLIGAGTQFDRNEENPATKRFQILVALILSSQATDKQTDIAMQRLLDHGLNIDSMLDIDYQSLDSMIKNLSFHNNKANYIMQTAGILRNQYNDDVPHTLKDFKGLPGCGFKVANLAMYYCRDTVCGIGVDTHCSRIMNKLGWAGPGIHSEKKANADSQAREMMKWLPSIIWGDINELLVGFGQTICDARNPKCGECAIESVCPWRQLNF